MRFYLSLILCSCVQLCLAQSAPYSTLQSVAPPSPEAISFARQTFSDVNLYAGKQNYSIPLYTLSQNGISVPITLNYTGGGGIKVEEVASSVGLGWSLQYTGVITRSIRGTADDANAGAYIGYMHLPGMDSTLFDLDNPYFNIYHDGYRYGKHDGQPDIFYVNAPGVSAMFYINKFKQIVFVEKSDLKVIIKFSQLDYHTIIGFEVIDLSGNTYVFDVRETNRTTNLTAPFPAEYNVEDASAWYLSKIKDPNGKVVFSFQYQASNQVVETNQIIRAPYQYTVDNQEIFKEDNAAYTMLYNKRPLLQKIITATGEIDFVMAPTTRSDFSMDKSIDSIIVKNYLGRPIRKFNFKYSYFSSSGVISVAEAQTYISNNPALRLKLDALEIIGNDNATKEQYSFTYNKSQLLPDRLTTFAMDHWGFYNGQHTNTTWEGKHRVRYYTLGFSSFLKEFGTANREPNSVFAQAGILKEVTTPLGGKIQFEYEGNTSRHPGLPNTVTPSAVLTSSYEVDNQKVYFSVNMIREPFAYIKVASPISTPEVKIEYTLQDSLESTPGIIDTLVMGSNDHLQKLQNGTYYIRARVVGYSSDPGYFYTMTVARDIETPILNKPVGGVRIKQMRLINPASEETYVRNYYYNEDGSDNPLSPTTGIIANVPKYGYQHIELFPEQYIPDFWTLYFVVPGGYVRQLSSTYPLLTTNGSYTGYAKVTTVDSEDLKSEYHYTTFSDFPELADGYYNTNPVNGQFADGGGTINGEWFEAIPFAPTDERDYFRGKLKKENIYKKEGGAFKKISSKENKYIFNYSIKLSKDRSEWVPDCEPDVLECIIFGLPKGCAFTGCSIFKTYRIHTGKYDLGKTIQKTFTYNGAQVDSLVVENTMEYGQAPGAGATFYRYLVTKVVQQTNSGADTTRLYYPFDWRYTNPDIAVADTSFLRKLEKANRIGMPFLEKKKSGATHVMTTKNIYSLFNTSHLNPSTIKVKGSGAASFEDRIYFTKYDTTGNILEQQKASDVTSSYLWNYKDSYPVAQVVGAGYQDIAYTSFEGDSKGNWSFSGSGSSDATAPTGTKSYTTSSTITRTGLSSTKTYLVSYWRKSGSATVNGVAGTAGETINGWTYYQHTITNPSGGVITLSGSGITLDELRLHPVNAQMTTYAHEPLIGVTHTCDANNQIMTYEYDAMGRLTLIRDPKGNIAKQTIYNIQNPSQP